MTPDDPRHGTRAGYYAHRKDHEPACLNCKRAAAAAEARRHLTGPTRLNPDPTTRRVRALIALGWTYLGIQRETGLEDAELRRFALGQRTYILAGTHAKIAAAYNLLAMRPPPETTRHERASASKARNRARRNGWQPPLAWDDIDAGILATPDPCDDHDPAVIERILGGDWRLPATPSERREVLRRWENSGRTARQLEALTGWNLARDKRRAA